MSFSVEIIKDSSYDGIRGTTFQLKYPRFIHSEFMTHRVFSRNASSSRAIPVEKMIEFIENDTAKPIHWGKNKPGMQADEECSAYIEIDGRSYHKFDAWNIARDDAIKNAKAFHRAGYHKQIVNRILEPYAHINVIVTATSFENFFLLRSHKDAQPEIKVLSDMMKDLYETNKPDEIGPGVWHLPYVSDVEKEKYDIDDQLKLTTARCARVSYLTHDGKAPSYEADIKIYDQLITSKPIHASPAEHQFQFLNSIMRYSENDDKGGNLGKGLVQYRKLIEGWWA